MPKSPTTPATGYCLFIDTICQGSVPLERGPDGNPFVYPTELAALRVIADDLIDRLSQFLSGEREFADAMTVGEYVQQVTVHGDGSITDPQGNHFGREEPWVAAG